MGCAGLTVWVLWAVVIVLMVVLAVLVAWVWVEVRRVADWTQSVELPQVEGFERWELRYILLAAARLEYPDKRSVIGRRRASFSRRSMSGLVGRHRFERLRDALAKQGYLVHRGERCSVRWTGKGRRLLYAVMSGRFGAVELPEVPDGRCQWRDDDVGGRLYRVDVR